MVIQDFHYGMGDHKPYTILLDPSIFVVRGRVDDF